MRSMFLETGTSEVQKYAETMRGLGLGEVGTLRYDEVGGSEKLLYARVKEFAPDLVVYIGSRWGIQPSIAALCKINSSIAPSVHICSDAADPPWHDLLREYHTAGAFTLQVAIDGNSKWPCSSAHMTALTPVDPAHFPFFPHHPPLHDARPIACGYAGNPGGGPQSQRTVLLSSLLQKRMIDTRIRSNLPYTYDSYCEYLTRCRMSLNVAYSGTEATKQVKGRVLESGLAGACLLETAGAPTSEWFRKGIDYLEYENADHCAAIIERLKHEPEETQTMADALRSRVLSEHSPSKFWGRIFDKIGIRQ